MGDLLTLDLSALLQDTMEMTGEVMSKLDKAAELLRDQALTHVQELAQEKLKSTLEIYLNNLDTEDIGEGVYAVVLKEPAMWIEEGRKAGSMIESFLKSPKAKTSSDGSKYLVVPFKHNKRPAQQTKKQQALLQMIKTEMKKQKIPYKAIEKNPDGSPKLGLIHKFNITPEKGSKNIFERIIGQRKQKSYLQGVRIYQKKTASGSVEKGILTFRTVSSKSGGWNYPGNTPARFFEETYRWVESEWEKIVDSIMEGK